MKFLHVATLIAFWLFLVFVLNLTWEIAQIKLYTLWKDQSATMIAKAIIHCSFGDLLIAAALYAITSTVLWCANWLLLSPLKGISIFTLCGLIYTSWSEWYNVYRIQNWNYETTMPLIFGIGIAPLLQWLLLPSVALLIYSRILQRSKWATKIQ